MGKGGERGGGANSACTLIFVSEISTKAML
jgi:hypothetical protein